MPDKLKSRKLWMAITAGVAGAAKALYPGFPDQALYTIAGACMGYVAVEGGVDAVAILAKWAVAKKAE